MLYNEVFEIGPNDQRETPKPNTIDPFEDNDNQTRNNNFHDNAQE